MAMVVVAEDSKGTPPLVLLPAVAPHLERHATRDETLKKEKWCKECVSARTLRSHGVALQLTSTVLGSLFIPRSVFRFFLRDMTKTPWQRETLDALSAYKDNAEGSDGRRNRRSRTSISSSMPSIMSEYCQ